MPTIKVNDQSVEVEDIVVTVTQVPNVTEIMQTAMDAIRPIVMSISVDIRNMMRSLRKLMRSLSYSPAAYRAGYKIVNHRGRNKLVDLRKISKGGK